MKNKLSILLSLTFLVSTAAYAQETIPDPKPIPPAAEQTPPIEVKVPTVPVEEPTAEQSTSEKQEKDQQQAILDQKIASLETMVRDLEKENDCQDKVAKEKFDCAKINANCLMWFIGCVLTGTGILVTLMIVVVGFTAWKNQGEYREAKRDASEKLSEIKGIVTEARKIRDELGEETKELVKESLAKAEKQRDFSEKCNKAFKASIDGNFELANTLWEEMTKEDPKDHRAFDNWGNALWGWAKLGGPKAEDRFRQACEKCARATELKPDFHGAFSNWGIVLSDWAKLGGPESEDRFRQACKQYARATDLNPDYHEAFYNWGNALSGWAKLGGPKAEDRFRQACEKCARATELKPDCHEAFNSWGNVLWGWAELGGPEAEDRFRQACEKYARATELKLDNYKIFSNWGGTLLLWAQLEGADKEKLLDDALEKLLRAEKLQEGCVAYSLACLWAIRGDEGQCKKWLELGEKKGTLVTRKYAVADKDLASVRDKDWFKQIKWKGE